MLTKSFFTLLQIVSVAALMIRGLQGPRILYFAYGSNMNKSVLSDKRKIAIRSILGPAILKNYRLAFNVIGIPLIEPSFASVAKAQGSEVHGLLVSLDLIEFLKLSYSEGVPVAYQPIYVQVLRYDSNDLMAAITFASGPFNLPIDQEVMPSKRYRNLLYTGAVETGLKQSYVDYLHALLDDYR